MVGGRFIFYGITRCVSWRRIRTATDVAVKILWSIKCLKDWKHFTLWMKGWAWESRDTEVCLPAVVIFEWEVIPAHDCSSN